MFFTVTAHSLGKPENWPKRAFPVWWVFCHVGSEPFLEMAPKQAVPHCVIQWGSVMGPRKWKSSTPGCWSEAPPARLSRALSFVQKLSVGILKKLGLQQSKARHLPLHLHACQLTLPALQPQKEELALFCGPPRYFVNSLRRLGLKMPSQDHNADEEAAQPGAQ